MWKLLKAIEGKLTFEFFSTGGNEKWLSVSSDHVFV